MSDDQVSQGRARGRSRGRARGQRPKEETRRPGQAEGTPPQPQMAAPLRHPGAMQSTVSLMHGRAPYRAADPMREPGRDTGGGRAAGAAALPALMTGLVVSPGNGDNGSRGGGGRAAGRAAGATAAALPSLMTGLVVSPGNGENGSRGAGRGATRGRLDAYIEPVTRPTTLTDKRGRHGKPVSLLTNYFRLESTPEWRVYHYHVDFAPEIDNSYLRKALLGVHKETVFKRAYLFDGMSLYLPIKLEHEYLELTSSRNSDGAIITIKLKLVKDLLPNDPICLQIFNIQLRRNFHQLDFKLLGRNYYDMHSSCSVRQHGLELWPGYVTSISQHETSQLMCVDLSFKVLRTDTVDVLLRDCLHKAKGNAPRMAQELLMGSIVLTRYNNKTYRIDEIDFNSNAKESFKMKDGSEISFIDYYQKHYGIKIKYPDMPLLLSLPRKRDIKRGQTDPVKLIPELCTMTGLTDEIRQDFNVMKDLAKYTRVGPAERVTKLQEYMRRLQGNQKIQEDLKEWNMRYGKDLVHLQGRVLPPEEISQRGSKLEYKSTEADWSRDMRGKLLQEAAQLQSWCVVVTQRDVGRAEEFLTALYRVSPPMDLRLPRAIIIRIPDDRTTTFLSAIKNEIVTKKVQLVLAVVPNNRAERYNAIKKLCCIEYAVPSQVILTKTLSKNTMSVATKVAIQLNCKLGGEVWTVPIPVNNIMVVGYDTYHDSSQKGQSVGGIVGSTNAALTKYYSKVAFQKSQQEMLDALCIHFVAILKNYYKYNNRLPERIIFYRDGVGQGQIPFVMSHEIKHIQESFKKIGPDYNPKFAFVIVTKRINTRFFCERERYIDNPPPGTIVDTEVTKPERYDFYLVSQSVRQGTVSPTNYNVIFDSTGFQPDHMQRLTYKLTHLYYNWPGTIRVPAPCQYAHKLAFLVGQSLHRDPNIQLANTLFYL